VFLRAVADGPQVLGGASSPSPPRAAWGSRSPSPSRCPAEARRDRPLAPGARRGPEVHAEGGVLGPGARRARSGRPLPGGGRSSTSSSAASRPPSASTRPPSTRSRRACGHGPLRLRRRPAREDARACLEALARAGAHVLPAETVFYSISGGPPIPSSRPTPSSSKNMPDSPLPPRPCASSRPPTRRRAPVREHPRPAEADDKDRRERQPVPERRARRPDRLVHLHGLLGQPRLRGPGPPRRARCPGRGQGRDLPGQALAEAFRPPSSLPDELTSPEVIANLVETAPEDADALWKEFNSFVESIACPSCGPRCGTSWRRSATRSGRRRPRPMMHHAYRHGLLEHTVHMARAARALLPLYREVDPDLAMAGILLHDAARRSSTRARSPPSGAAAASSRATWSSATSSCARPRSRRSSTPSAPSAWSTSSSATRASSSGGRPSSRRRRRRSSSPWSTTWTPRWAWCRGPSGTRPRARSSPRGSWGSSAPLLLKALPD
jgi:hypothetical protein